MMGMLVQLMQIMLGPTSGSTYAFAGLPFAYGNNVGSTATGNDPMATHL